MARRPHVAAPRVPRTWGAASRTALRRFAPAAFAPAVLTLAVAGCGEPTAVPATNAAATAPAVNESTAGAPEASAVPVVPASSARPVPGDATGAGRSPDRSAPDRGDAADAELAATLAGLPANLRGRFADLPERWAARQGDPLAAAAAAVTLQEAARLLMDFDEERAYDAFRLSGEAATLAAAAGALPDAAAGQIFYNAACALARDDEVAAAFASLDRAAEAGFSGWEHAETDPDLAALHSTPGFAARLAGWKAASPASAGGSMPEPLLSSADLSGGSGPDGLFPLEFAYMDVSGRPHRLSDYRGQVVVVDFWGTWCPPCRTEIPSFVRLQQQYGPDGLQILGLNYNDDVGDIRQFALQNDMNYPTGPGPDEARAAVPNFRGYPTTVFVGRDGRVRKTLVGAHPYESLEGVVLELLAERVEPADLAQWPTVPDEPRLTDLKKAQRLADGLDRDLLAELDANWELQFEEEAAGVAVARALGGLAGQAEQAGGTAALALPPHAGEIAAQIAAAFPDSAAADDGATFAPVFLAAAAALAQRRDTREALTFLERAATTGWTDWAAVEKNPAFRTLSDEEEFQQRLARWTGADPDAGLSGGGLTGGGPGDAGQGDADGMAAEPTSNLPPAEQAAADLAAAEPFTLSFIARDLDDNRQRPRDYEGQVLLVNLWGFGNEAGEGMIPDLVALQTEHKDAGLRTLGLAYDPPAVADVEAFVAERGVNYPVGIGNQRAKDAVEGYRDLPTTVFVGRDGTARLVVTGPRSRDYLEAVATTLLAEPAPAEQ
ncbi:redoxin domain-containing protein [Alienimonas californiensis]|uniref:Thiol-disulfide oxidoreductase ResA n=1 Tax=Alienimonas californiensis TaxID=2527989 RepID=A0A517P7I4_9PLAN|nr:TlpA disulfide reductase family protein [Alienimonas californiensis]QDT15323.1 Thiol-disulfide oxidoreductase ResA [Alienimonas californiensis]